MAGNGLGLFVSHCYTLFLMNDSISDDLWGFVLREHLKVIQGVVSAFLEKNHQITAEDLKSLEKETQEAIIVAIAAAKSKGPAAPIKVVETVSEPVRFPLHQPLSGLYHSITRYTPYSNHTLCYNS